MKRGFTLIEILAVVTIIGLVFVFAMPKIVNTLKNKKSDVDTTTTNLIVTAAKSYVSDNQDEFDKDESNIYCLPLNTLTKKDYLESPVKNVTDDKNITNSKSVKITYDKGFKYEIVDKKDCNTSSSQKIYVDNGGKKYRRISYLESTGSQYISTGYSAPKTENHKFVVDFQLMKIGSEQQTVMGYDLNDAKITSNGYLQGNTSYPYIGLNRRVLTIEYSPTNGGSNHFITMDTDDGQHAERNSTYWPSETSLITMFTNSKNITTRMAWAKIYSAKIYTGETLVRDFVPVVDSNYIACMFDNVTKECFYNEGKGVFKYDYSKIKVSKKTLSTDLLAKKNDSNVSTYTSGNTHEMYTFSHSATVQTPALTDFRYIGSEPYNYLYFNNELWHIIGIFSVEDENGDYEQRIKIIKDEGIGGNSIYYSEEGSNYWVTSGVNSYLNTTYYNSLLSEYKNLIKTSKFYLAGAGYPQDGSEFMYNAERGNDTYVVDGVANDRSWVGKIALPYPSDYVYTFAYGIDNVCYENARICDEARGGDPTKSWIYNDFGLNKYSWLITASTTYNYMYLIDTSGPLNPCGPAKNIHNIVPTVYISSDVKYILGNGSISNPYVLSLNS